MATPVFSQVTRGQGSFVSRTKKAFDEGLHAFTSAYEVSASTTYEPTSSFKPTAFYIQEGTNYTLSPVDGGSNLTKGFVTGQIYNIALKKVITVASTKVILLK